MGQRMKERDFDEMIKAASMNENGLINLQGKIMNGISWHNKCVFRFLFLLGSRQKEEEPL